MCGDRMRCQTGCVHPSRGLYSGSVGTARERGGWWEERTGGAGVLRIRVQTSEAAVRGYFAGRFAVSAFPLPGSHPKGRSGGSGHRQQEWRGGAKCGASVRRRDAAQQR